MSKSKRKAGGCTHGRFKMKKMGKGWAMHRRVRGRPLPIDRSESAPAEADKRAADKRAAEQGAASEAGESGAE